MVPVQPADSFTASPLPWFVTVSVVMFTWPLHVQFPSTVTAPVVGGGGFFFEDWLLDVVVVDVVVVVVDVVVPPLPWWSP
jgi:hypothetical protein